jgi:hypothetical protein
MTKKNNTTGCSTQKEQKRTFDSHELCCSYHLQALNWSELGYYLYETNIDIFVPLFAMGHSPCYHINNNTETSTYQYQCRIFHTNSLSASSHVTDSDFCNFITRFKQLPSYQLNKKFWKELICLLSLHYLKMSFALKPAFAPT